MTLDTKTHKQIDAVLKALAKRNGRLLRSGVPDRIFSIGQALGLWTGEIERGIHYCYAW